MIIAIGMNKSLIREKQAFLRIYSPTLHPFSLFDHKKHILSQRFSWSSATHRASTCSATENPCISRSALLLDNVVNDRLKTPVGLSKLQTGSLLKFQTFVGQIHKISKVGFSINFFVGRFRLMSYKRMSKQNKKPFIAPFSPYL